MYFYIIQLNNQDPNIDLFAFSSKIRTKESLLLSKIKVYTVGLITGYFVIL